MALLRMPYRNFELLLPKDDLLTYYQTFVVGQYKRLRIRKGDYVLDAGASFGDFTMLACAIVGPSGRVVALEPDPTYYSILRKNLETNGITNCYAYQAALAENIGRFFPCSGSGVRRTESVPAITSRSLLQDTGLPQFDLIKLDIEGAEEEVLRETSWLRGVRELTVETHGETFWPVMKTLAVEGFRTYVYNEKDLLVNSLTFLFQHPMDLLRAEAYSRLTALRHLFSFKRRPPMIVDKSSPWLRLIYAQRKTGDFASSTGRMGIPTLKSIQFRGYDMKHFPKGRFQRSGEWARGLIKRTNISSAFEDRGSCAKNVGTGSNVTDHGLFSNQILWT
jgi:FkbM family methyltransferase